MMTTPSDYDQAKADAFKMNMLGVITHTLLMTTIRLGHELGLFHDLVESGASTSQDLAARTKLSPRHVYEWCLHATSTGILEYNEENDTFALPPEHATILDSNEGLTPMMCGLVENISYQYPLLKLAYQTDGGVFWGDMRGFKDACRDYFKPVYEQLMPMWVDLSPELKADMTSPDAKIADVGCGCGISTCSMATNFPNANVLGVDYHAESIEEAKAKIEDKKLTNAEARVVDSHVWADDEEQGSFDVITMFDCFHDMSDPEGVAVEALKALRPGGKIFLIEPYSSKGDSIKDKLSSPFAPTFQGFNTCHCTPCGKSIPGKEGLGTTCGTDHYEELFTKAGFSSFTLFGEESEGPTAPTGNGFRLMLVTK